MCYYSSMFHPLAISNVVMRCASQSGNYLFPPPHHNAIQEFMSCHLVSSMTICHLACLVTNLMSCNIIVMCSTSLALISLKKGTLDLKTVSFKSFLGL